MNKYRSETNIRSINNFSSFNIDLKKENDFNQVVDEVQNSPLFKMQFDNMYAQEKGQNDKITLKQIREYTQTSILDSNRRKLENKSKRKGFFSNVKNSFSDFFTSCKGSELSLNICKDSTSMKKQKDKKTLKKQHYFPLQPEQKLWLQNNYNIFKYQQLKKLPKSSIKKVLNILYEIKIYITHAKLNYWTKDSCFECLEKLKNYFQQAEIKQFSENNNTNYAKGNSLSTTSNHIVQLKNSHYFTFLAMLAVFKAFIDHYTCFKRKILKMIFKKLQNQQFNNSREVLRYLEHNDPQIKKMKHITQEELDDKVKNIFQNCKQVLQDYKSERNIERLNKISIVNISELTERRRVVNIVIGGFLSENYDKKRQWKQYLKWMPDSQIYGLKWESSTLKNFKKTFKEGFKQFLAGKMSWKTWSKSSNNFVDSFNAAVTSGHQLAHVVHNLLPHQIINFFCFSLGVEIIRAFIQRTVQLNGGVMINKITCMGGASDISEFESTLLKCQNPIEVINISSQNDFILTHMLPIAKPKIKPMGIGKLNETLGNHSIKNIDVSKKIKGHTSYMKNLKLVISDIKIHDE